MDNLIHGEYGLSSKQTHTKRKKQMQLLTLFRSPSRRKQQWKALLHIQIITIKSLVN
jgi:hypothetical protein